MADSVRVFIIVEFICEKKKKPSVVCDGAGKNLIKFFKISIIKEFLFLTLKKKNSERERDRHNI